MVYAGALASGAFAGQHVVLFGNDVTTPFWAYIAVCLAGTLGYLFGSEVGWWIGWKGGRPLAERHGGWLHLGPERLARAERWFDRWDDRAVLFGRVVPLVRSFISVPAGIFRMPLGRYTVLDHSRLGALVPRVRGYRLGGRRELRELQPRIRAPRGRTRGRSRGARAVPGSATALVTHPATHAGFWPAISGARPPALARQPSLAADKCGLRRWQLLEGLTPRVQFHSARRRQGPVRAPDPADPGADRGGARLRRLHPRAERPRVRGRGRRLPRRAADGRRGERDRRARARARRDGDRPRRRGDLPFVHVLRDRRVDRPPRRDPGLRGHRPGHAEPRSRGRRRRRSPRGRGR